LNDTERLKLIGEVEPKDRIAFSHEQIWKEAKEKFELIPSSNVWELGYWSTDEEEDNDTSEEENDDYYDEEEDENEEDEKEIDPTTLI